ncbi:leucyl/phenylalanyl-tRNA--protein transferase [Sphingomonas morindae]|uniref:Leucyl/phenylalanyl-tRNA--protein transferase n=1 Tax=Sphingomonas morindae TaxID=1541170 RepID=A0ABY4XCG9_9SPHN|nr:leucyl/phenylalanyl-tRNA--protein transferase [Sphingomonas morindae]USI74524.1 leucyl/phenylalanyl-tRNA--protein transferase [Sphingomonas morindae]
MLGRGRRVAAEPIDPDLLVRAYSVGVFPMADSREAPDIFWVEPKKRGVLPLDRFHLSRSLAKLLRSERFSVTADRAFGAVVAACAEATADRPETWINRQIEDAYGTLHRRGYAHSIEVWEGSALVGGLYGVALGRAFFGESMFSRAPNASKLAMAHLVARLRHGGFTLLDCQFITDHLASLGAVEISRSDYRALLDDALSGTAAAPSGAVAGASPSGDFFAADAARGAPADTALASTVSGPTSGWVIAQLLGQTS